MYLVHNIDQIHQLLNEPKNNLHSSKLDVKHGKGEQIKQNSP
jgi:hypothetical protein